MRKRKASDYQFKRAEERYLGKIFGRLTVISVGRMGDNPREKRQVVATCECGSSAREYAAENLRFGITRSCGCLQREASAKALAITRRLKTAPEEIQHLNKKMAQYRQGAKSRALSFNLTAAQFKTLVKSACIYCLRVPQGIHFSQLNGIDRVDNAIGYEPSNVVPCCKDCNFSKGSKTRAEFIEHCRRVVSFAEAA